MVIAVKAKFSSKSDTDIIVYNEFTKSGVVVDTIQASEIKPYEYVTHFLKTPVYIRANQYVGFGSNGGLLWGTNMSNSIGGSYINSSGTWENQLTVIMDYSLFIRKKKERVSKK